MVYLHILYVCVPFQHVEDDSKTWFIISSSVEVVLYMGRGEAVWVQPSGKYRCVWGTALFVT